MPLMPAYLDTFVALCTKHLFGASINPDADLLLRIVLSFFGNYVIQVHLSCRNCLLLISI
jgi:hypothetical protein